MKGQLVEYKEKVLHAMTDNGGPRKVNRYFDHSVSKKRHHSGNNNQVHELLMDFLHYFAAVLEYWTDPVSIWRGVRTSRAERSWVKEIVYLEWEEKHAH